MIYQYKFVTLPVDDSQRQTMEFGMADMSIINPIIESCINEQAKDGWEPFYPFSFPAIWFRKPVTKTRTK